MRSQRSSPLAGRKSSFQTSLKTSEMWHPPKIYKEVPARERFDRLAPRLPKFVTVQKQGPRRDELIVLHAELHDHVSLKQCVVFDPPKRMSLPSSAAAGVTPASVARGVSGIIRIRSNDGLPPNEPRSIHSGVTHA